MVIKSVVFLGGVLALLVGCVGLAAPVNVSAGQHVIECGTALIPDLAAAKTANNRAERDESLTPEIIATNTDFTRLCHMELVDRRLGAGTLAGCGAVAVVVAGALLVSAKRRRTLSLR